MTENHTRRHRGPRLTPPRALPPWSLVAAGVLAGGLLGGGYGVLRPAEYTATSYLVAVPGERSDSAGALGFAQAYGRIATQPAVLAKGIDWLVQPKLTVDKKQTITLDARKAKPVD
ncbi:lipopolysaccharide biosynthesis protein, partial [Streptomyces eurythermus]